MLDSIAGLSGFEIPKPQGQCPRQVAALGVITVPYRANHFKMKCSPQTESLGPR
jgi:hypothetical protein